eukprot:m.262313 g.262313  ORF g.262313 m.262313 type:complete len:53 (-) comp25452_c0_seq1:44-202(-)
MTSSNNPNRLICAASHYKQSRSKACERNYVVRYLKLLAVNRLDSVQKSAAST